MKCPYCNEIIENHLEECPICGESLPTQKCTEYRCPYCNEVIPEDSTVCPICAETLILAQPTEDYSYLQEKDTSYLYNKSIYQQSDSDSDTKKRIIFYVISVVVIILIKLFGYLYSIHH